MARYGLSGFLMVMVPTFGGMPISLLSRAVLLIASDVLFSSTTVSAADA
jgi:hypothetical protein